MMKHWLIAILAGTLMSAAAAAAPPDGAPGEAEASVEERLEDAQRRLEEAARDVAELSGAAAGPWTFRAFDGDVRGPRRAMLGVNVGSEPSGGGVRVDRVSPGGAAAEAGVKAGDVIVSIDAKPVATGRELVRAMESIEPGDKVKLSLRRDGKPLELTVEPRPFALALAHPATLPHVEALPFHGGAHWLLGGWGDTELVTLTPGLGRYFGADEGVLVARVPDDASLGLRDGDVILSIGGRKPQDGPHAMRILRSYEPGERVEIRILRDRREQALSATIPERPARDVRRRPAPPKPPTAPEPPAPPARASAAR